MDIHKIIESTMKVTEEEMVLANEPQVPSPELSSEEAPVVAEKPAITPELIDSLIADMPELADCDKEMLMKGMEVELEHFDSVGGDINAVARIACDHIKEFAGKDYYAALAVMEEELKETPEEEKAEHAEGGEEGPASEEIPAGEPPVEEPAMESKVEEKKEPKDSELEAMKREANKKEEDRKNKKEADKKK